MTWIIVNVLMSILTWGFFITKWSDIKNKALSLQTYILLVKYSFLGIWEFVKPYLKIIIFIVLIIWAIFTIWPNLIEQIDKIIQTKEIWVKASQKPSFLLTLLNLVFINPFKLFMLILGWFIGFSLIFETGNVNWFSYHFPNDVLLILAIAALLLWIIAFKRAYKEEMIYKRNEEHKESLKDIDKIKEDLKNERY